MTSTAELNRAAAVLAKVVVDMADRREAPGNYSMATGRYRVNLFDMSDEHALSFAAYLLLYATWNDALDWAKHPSAYIDAPRKPRTIGSSSP